VAPGFAVDANEFSDVTVDERRSRPKIDLEPLEMGRIVRATGEAFDEAGKHARFSVDEDGGVAHVDPIGLAPVPDPVVDRDGRVSRGRRLVEELGESNLVAGMDARHPLLDRASLERAFGDEPIRLGLPLPEGEVTPRKEGEKVSGQQGMRLLLPSRKRGGRICRGQNQAIERRVGTRGFGWEGKTQDYQYYKKYNTPSL